eukprot:105247_1
MHGTDENSNQIGDTNTSESRERFKNEVWNENTDHTNENVQTDEQIQYLMAPHDTLRTKQTKDDIYSNQSVPVSSDNCNNRNGMHENMNHQIQSITASLHQLSMQQLPIIGESIRELLYELFKLTQ